MHSHQEWPIHKDCLKTGPRKPTPSRLWAACILFPSHTPPDVFPTKHRLFKIKYYVKSGGRQSRCFAGLSGSLLGFVERAWQGGSSGCSCGQGRRAHLRPSPATHRLPTGPQRAQGQGLCTHNGQLGAGTPREGRACSQRAPLGLTPVPLADLQREATYLWVPGGGRCAPEEPRHHIAGQKLMNREQVPLWPSRTAPSQNQTHGECQGLLLQTVSEQDEWS